MDYQIIELEEFSVIGIRYELSKSLSNNVKLAQNHWKIFNSKLRDNKLYLGRNWCKYAFIEKIENKIFYYISIPKKDFVSNDFAEKIILKSKYLKVEHIGNMNKLKDINSIDNFNDKAEEIYNILYTDKPYTIDTLWKKRNKIELFGEQHNPFITSVLVLLGYKLHDKNMEDKNYSSTQKELYKKRVLEALTNDIYIRKLEGIRISQMIWAVYFINTKLIEVGRLQYEKCENCIKIHIPSGDKLEKEKVLNSIRDSKGEIEKYFNLKHVEPIIKEGNDMKKIAEYKDIEELSRLRIMQQKDDWKELYPGKDKEFYNITKGYLEEHLNKDVFFFIEIIDNKIVATCGLQVIKYMPQCVESGIEGYICDVFTLKEYRKKGIQTNLIKECIKFAKENNIIELKLSSDNPNAIKIYKEQGFEYDRLIMKKEI